MTSQNNRYPPTQYQVLTRRKMLQSSLACAALPFLTNCGAGATIMSTPPSPTNQPVPAGPLTEASLSVTAQSAGVIGPAFAGLSFEKSNVQFEVLSGQNSDLIALCKLLGPSLLRVGGDTVDRSTWTPNGAGKTSFQIGPPDVDALAEFLQATGWQCLYAVNMGGAGPYPYQGVAVTTPDLAAAEVNYVAQRLGSSLAGIEIGNETNFYGGKGHYFSGNWSLSQFIALWQEFRQAIVALTPNVAVTGPAAGGYNDPEAVWTIPFGQAVTSNQITLLTQHHYRNYGGVPSVDTLVSPDANLLSILATLQSGAASIGVPYRLAETNSGGPDGVPNSYASALWTVDFLFNLAQYHCAGANFHGAGAAYSPILLSGGSVVSAQPEYHGMLFFNLAGQGTLYNTQISTGGLNVTAYAVKPSTGALNLVIVNKDSTQNLHVTAQLPHEAAAATLVAMTQLSPGATDPSLAATDGVMIQGSSVAPDGTFTPSEPQLLRPSGTQLEFYVPALSAVVVHVF